ncbi:F-box only protein 7-like Protein [Tribolium castaneum]|uniref:F-box only protein 7-like Protein n=1 Tax=Tribolium castaneum TaxID=7070 RepID=D6X124_TRICA|nr:F-box only protein 7-like Protein [Tribolium castaneum]
MAESECSVKSNSPSTHNHVSVVQMIADKNEEEDETHQVMEPMLLEEYKYGHAPRSIVNILEFFNRNKLPSDKNDIIVGFLYVLMLECGFVEMNCTDILQDDCNFNYKRLLQHSKTLPEAWKRDSRYQLNFILKSSPQLVCRLTCMSVSDDLLVNCTIKDVDNFSFLADPLMYFITSKVQFNEFHFQNLDHLSRSFKDSVAFPAKVAVIESTGGICTCLQHLPYEILIRIMSYLNISDVMNLARTSTSLCQVAQDSALWVKLLASDLKKKNIVKTYEELKFLYQIKYARELTKMMN